MPQWSSWHACHSDGQIPDSLLPAAVVQLRYFIQLQADTRYLDGPIGLSTWKGRWRWTISTNKSSMDVHIFDLFDQTVDMEVDLVYYKPFDLFGGGGALSFFTWWWYDGANDVYTWKPQPALLNTGFLGGYPLTSGGWHLEEREHGRADPAGYPPGTTDEDPTPDPSGYTDHEVYVNLWYYSQAYRLNVPTGAYLDIPFATVGANISPFVHGTWNPATMHADAPSMLIKRANTHVRTIAGSSFGTMVDGPGFHRLARPITQASEQAWSTDYRNYDTRRIPKPLTNTSIGKEPDNALLVHGYWSTRWVLLRSRDDGLTWEEAYAVTFDDNYTDARMTVARDGAGVVIARKDNYLWSKTSRDGWVSTARVGPATGAMELTSELSSGVLVATDGHSITYLSRDGGLTWEESAWAAT